ncbi:MAG TPA: cupin domain-containing protein [Solirubrobacteraceae bacterium]|nr:cupin domain-containing protein [Solirubrobacteraceae bacterium]
MAPAVAHHADIREEEVAHGDIAFRRRRLGHAAGSLRIGASHYVVPPHARQMPVHVHGDEEEIFFVLTGDGVGYELQGQDPEGEAITYRVQAGDVVVHRPERAPHTFIAGENGLELIAFGSGSESSITYLPRAGVMWCGPRWVPVDAPHPFAAEAAAGPLRPTASEPGTPRPNNVAALTDLETGRFPPAEIRTLGMAAGSVKAGLNHVVLPSGSQGAPPHCHTLEEELFVVLAGGGTLTLGAASFPLVAGDVIARPPSGRVAHALTAGAEGLTYLAYGTREPGDAILYPDTGRVWIRGIDVWLDASLH